jgi:hypothetical protein
MTRPSIVIRKNGNVGIVLHKDGSVRFQRLGPYPQPLPDHAIEEFDMVTDKTWSIAASGLSRIFEWQRKSEDVLPEALELLEKLMERTRWMCEHTTYETDSGLLVCKHKGCDVQRASKLLVEDYDTAKFPEGKNPRARQLERSEASKAAARKQVTLDG